MTPNGATPFENDIDEPLFGDAHLMVTNREPSMSLSELQFVGLTHSSQVVLKARQRAK